MECPLPDDDWDYAPWYQRGESSAYYDEKFDQEVEPAEPVGFHRPR